MLGNADLRISYSVSDATSPFYRNAIGDECVYVQAGSARVETVFGALDVREGDFVILPRTTVHRWVPTDVEGAGPLRTYAIEANSHVAPPKRYLSRYGRLLEHSPYCERDLHGPVEPLLAEGATSRCSPSTAGAAAAGWWAASSSRPRTRSTSSGGTAASTRTRST
ncbi:hypothetical protein GCM10025868_11440 [Angustibacter aerolatus]|uniref:Cupin 2 conserved barrel domain-containing protein n=1 Tax=Angustibacter aerolatus TaxID=1162965 RepID=A0ABQ6JFH4_9ACTN|nr:hypothetical protein [Angustibacter aerolatus]GMA85894.1 hypothetical protein GCM10025868_11440 [Angustibacter aerolatus]